MDELNFTTPDTTQGVRQIAVPPAARALSTLSRIDYADAFVLETGPGEVRTPEEWARVVLEGAPLTVRTKLLMGWSALGLKLAYGHSARSVLGWGVRVSEPEFALLGADSRIGMRGELLFKPEPDCLLFATFVEQNNPAARAVWAATEPTHVAVVLDILAQTRQRLRRISVDG
jgi:hypothetical protein